MRKVIAMVMAVVLMVAVAAPAAYAGDAAANAALGLAAFAVFSQFVMPMLTGQPVQPAYAPAPYYSGPAYPPPPPPVVYEPRVYVEPPPASYPSYGSGYGYQYESHRPHGQWQYAPQAARPAYPWGWGGRTGRAPSYQAQ